MDFGGECMRALVDFSSLTDEEKSDLANRLLDRAMARGLVIDLPERREPYTCAEAAKALNVSVSTVHNLVKAGRLQVIAGLSVKMITAESLRAVRDARG